MSSFGGILGPFGALLCACGAPWGRGGGENGFMGKADPKLWGVGKATLNHISNLLGVLTK